MKTRDMTSLKIDNLKDCCGCAACFNICPKSAIQMEIDAEGFRYPAVDNGACIQCGLCRKACPILVPPKKNQYVKTYGGYASDVDEQMTSSSGAVFALLAKQVLLAGGYVCGAAFAENFSVKHIIIHSMDELHLLKGTKYVQSEIGNCYFEIKKLLQSSNQVLFSGTPCQVAGLKAFLNNDDENLFTIDLICHGVPSPTVWQHYLHELSEETTISKVNFRHKNENGSFFLIKYGDQELCEQNTENLYIQGFLKNYYVRPSCFACRFKGFQRCSDITIGDFWGITEYHPSFSNGKGTSAVIVHSQKGQRSFDLIARESNIIEVPPKELVLWNENLLYPTEHNPLRDKFYTEWQEKGVILSVKELLSKEIKATPKPNRFMSQIILRIKRFV